MTVSIAMVLALACGSGDDSGGSADGAEDCSDGLDNDGNGVADCADPACQDSPDCPAEEPQLRINEFMASNATTIADGAGGFADWIELYNPTDQPVSLDGWTITDDLDQPDKVDLDPSLRVPAGGFLLLWADGDVDEGPDHLPFRLDAAGEAIGIFDAYGTRSDGLEYDAQTTDISAARVPDGSDNWTLTDQPTPGSSNGTGS